MNIRQTLAKLIVFRDQDRVENGGQISMRQSARANREQAQTLMKLARKGTSPDASAPEDIFKSPLGRAAAWLGATIDAGQYVVYTALSLGEKEK